MSCCKNKSNRCEPGDNSTCFNGTIYNSDNNCYNGASSVDIKYALDRESCRNHRSGYGNSVKSNRNMDNCNGTNCCEKPSIKCKPINLGCEECTEYRLCTDANGCAYLYPCQCRDPFWPEFSRPRSLCCSQLYRKCATISQEEEPQECCQKSCC